MWHIVFSHGKESGPWGGKICHLADIATSMGCTFASLDYQNQHDPDQRVSKLCHYLKNNTPAGSKVILTGSSMGAYVSLMTSKHFTVAGLFLLAPALGIPGYADSDPVPHAGSVEVVHGWHDELIPVTDVVQWCSKHNCILHCVNDSHRLLNALTVTGEWFRIFLRTVMLKG